MKKRRKLKRTRLGRPKGAGRTILRLALVEALMLPALGCDPFRTDFDDTEVAIPYTASELTPAKSSGPNVNVMTWNLKFGGGRIDFFFDCHGDRVHMTESEVVRNLDRIVEKVTQVNPDILLIQEVDVDSKRCAYIDMMQYILDHTDLNYGVYASQWKADYVPSYGIGRINSGNGILSKYKLTSGERIQLPLIEEQDALTRYFWLKRNILTAGVQHPSGAITAVNVHTAAFAQDGTKQEQIDIFYETLAELDDRGVTFVAGGDLNTIPPGTENTAGFDDSVCPKGDFEADDYSEELEWTRELYDRFAEAIPLETYIADESKYYSHTTDRNGFWNRRLDYLFSNGSLVDGRVHQDKTTGMETMPLSDHAPVTAVLER